jgi:hypothetical protein
MTLVLPAAAHATTARDRAAPAPHVRAAAIGEALPGELAAPGDRDVWTFAGRSRQRIFIQTTSGPRGCGATHLTLTLRRPAGSVRTVRNLSGCADRGPLTLDASGRWSLAVASTGGDRGGAYSIRIWDVPPRAARRLAIGDVASGAIRTPGAQERWAFAGTAGEHVTFDVRQVAHACPYTALGLSVTGPGDTVLFADHELSLCADRRDVILPSTGSYVAQIGAPADDETTAPYRFAVVDTAAACFRHPGAGFWPGGHGEGLLPYAGSSGRWPATASPRSTDPS